MAVAIWPQSEGLLWACPFVFPSILPNAFSKIKGLALEFFLEHFLAHSPIVKLLTEFLDQL